MLVDLVDKLLDRIIGLMNYRSEVRKTLLDDHITPIYSEFELVHKGYLESFEKYRELIKSGKYPLDIELQPSTETQIIADPQIIAIIKHDLVFNIDKNIKIYEMAKAYDNNDSLSAFISSIQSYLIGVKYDVQVDMTSNVWRSTLINELYKISAEERTEEEKAISAIKCLDSVVLKMQGRYQEVTKEYYKLKKKLSGSPSTLI